MRYEKVICAVAFINVESQERDLTVNGAYPVGGPKSMLIDNVGYQYDTVVQIGDRGSHNFVSGRFVPQLLANVLFSAERVNPDATYMSVVIGIQGSKTTPVVRDIPITK